MITTHQMQEIFRSGSYGARLGVTHNMILTLDEWLPWLAARTFQGLTFTNKDDGWLIVLRATSQNKPQVAFFAGVSPEDAAVVMAHSLLFDLASWKPDKWAATRIDKNKKPR